MDGWNKEKGARGRDEPPSLSSVVAGVASGHLRNYEALGSLTVMSKECRRCTPQSSATQEKVSGWCRLWGASSKIASELRTYTIQGVFFFFG